MTVIEKLKSLDLDREQLDDLILYFEQGQQLRAGYERAQMDTPEWLTGALDTLDVDIKRRSRDMLLLRMKELETAEKGLQTAAERRLEIAAQKEKLQRRLGLTPAAQ